MTSWRKRHYTEESEQKEQKCVPGDKTHSVWWRWLLATCGDEAQALLNYLLGIETLVYRQVINVPNVTWNICWCVKNYKHGDRAKYFHRLGLTILTRKQLSLCHCMDRHTGKLRNISPRGNRPLWKILNRQMIFHKASEHRQRHLLNCATGW